jgi:SAM-dependent methyltransferase
MTVRALIKSIPLAASAYALLRLVRGRNARFASDYQHNSGVGSNLEATRVISRSLRDSFDALSVRSVLDIPCGDFVWMQHVDLRGIDYTGADVIEELIVRHQQTHSGPQKHFTVLDLVTADLPQVDLVFCRDCLVHLSNRLARRALANIKRSRSRYLLTTTFPDRDSNPRIVTGNWRSINLCAAPFNLPPPLRVLTEGYPEPYSDKSLGLWKVSDIPSF